jgi:hypothetical protein
MTLLIACHLPVCGLCHSKPTLFLAHSRETSMQCFRSPGEESLAKMAIISSAGRREMGDKRHRSSMARRSASSSVSGDMEGASEDWESLVWNMRESLSSSSTPRSGEVDAEVSEREVLMSRSARREREREREAMACSLGNVVAVGCLPGRKTVVAIRRCGDFGSRRLRVGRVVAGRVVKQAVGGSTLSDAAAACLRCAVTLHRRRFSLAVACR